MPAAHNRTSGAGKRDLFLFPSAFYFCLSRSKGIDISKEIIQNLEVRFGPEGLLRRIAMTLLFLKRWVIAWFFGGVVIGAFVLANIFFNPALQDLYRVKFALGCGVGFWSLFGLIAWGEGDVDWQSLADLPTAAQLDWDKQWEKIKSGNK